MITLRSSQTTSMEIAKGESGGQLRMELSTPGGVVTFELTAFHDVRDQMSRELPLLVNELAMDTVSFFLAIVSTNRLTSDFDSQPYNQLDLVMQRSETHMHFLFSGEAVIPELLIREHIGFDVSFEFELNHQQASFLAGFLVGAVHS